MSLTSVLDTRIVKERFLAEFPKPEFTGMEKVPIKAPPVTAKYGLVGRAFDYLFRFYLQKLNPAAHAGDWVAQKGLECLRKKGDPAYKRAKNLFENAQGIHRKFMSSPLQRPTREIAEATIILSHLECVFRVGKLDPMLFDPTPPAAVLDDLEAMLALVPVECFRACHRCVLNPKFGSLASRLVGGADGDLVIDDTLIDIKTNKDLTFGRDIFNQLVGYYLLWRMASIEHCSKAPITHVAAYFARFGVLHRISVSKFINEARLPEFLQWFTSYLRENGRKDRPNS